MIMKETNNKPVKPMSDLTAVSARVKRHNAVRLMRSRTSEAAVSGHTIKSLKLMSSEQTEELGQESEPFFLLRIWHQFQEAIGNR